MKRFWYNKTFELENGESLAGLEIAYNTYGNLSPSGDNVVWVCHALTSNSDVFAWWPGLFGTGKLFDPEKYFIVCANVIGGCYGTTGPISLNPETRRMYAHDFPEVTIRDMAMAHNLLREHLGISSIAFGIGGSMGGMQILDWASSSPELFERIVLIATAAKASPWVKAWNEAQRMSIEMDPSWPMTHVDAGTEGLKAARAIALLSYRNADIYDSRQMDDDKISNVYAAQSYQRYQGKKLAKRFNAISYHRLTRAMDHHHVGRGKGGIQAALKRIKSKVLCIGISSDLLFPIKEQFAIAEQLRNVKMEIISSVFGHDGFLLETEVIGKHIQSAFFEAYDSMNGGSLVLAESEKNEK